MYFKCSAFLTHLPYGIIFCLYLCLYYLRKQVSNFKLLNCVRLFATPWTIAYQAHPSMGFFRQEYWSGFSFPSPGDLPDEGIKPGSPTLQADALPPEPPGKSLLSSRYCICHLWTCDIYLFISLLYVFVLSFNNVLYFFPENLEAFFFKKVFLDTLEQGLPMHSTIVHLSGLLGTGPHGRWCVAGKIKTIIPSHALVHGKIVFRETGSRCQKGWRQMP